MQPLEGIRIVEFAGLAPAPFAAMMLADHGAEVVRIERAGWTPPIPPDKDILRRNRAEILTLDLKDQGDLARVCALVRDADGLIEGFRPGVMERLSLGPDDLRVENPRLVYGRMTGWGQAGPLAAAAGHDINYIALAGNLHGYGRAGGPPTPPANAVGDFGGGGMLLAFAMLAGLLSARTTGKGSVIDCAMVDGAALLGAQTYGLLAAGMWCDARGANLLDGGAAFYDSYECADGRWVAIGALEPPFFAVLKDKLGLASSQFDPALRDELSATFRRHPRQHWCTLLEGTDACFAPILTLSEAPDHPHNAFRGTFATIDGLLQPSPAPRFEDL
ncbi:CaiB/BaiF CoA-transferase family protein [Sphingosinicella sp. LHD-64]|uniref:CaiB/BaiF CoA transferase family protein n=1 Tax=Sphingosinicella sp. LHD-64 TaxID=3072139 RepID=UPI00280E78EA|nr:CaiB/BaiF CoA-transferase family protein [Sphingosinicella sp. LHD-64]MDQ8754706.1 CaiB/BaiF CoA-transferase family protein [Sphingosinicella sp. LHD-64]